MHRETDALQDDVAERIGHDGLLDRIATVAAAIEEPITRDARRHMLDRALGVALLLREIALAVRDHEAAVPRAGLIDTRIVDLVQDAVADREGDAARRVERGPDPGLGARRPGRFDARMSGRIFEIGHHRPRAGAASPKRPCARVAPLRRPNLRSASAFKLTPGGRQPRLVAIEDPRAGGRGRSLPIEP